MKLKPVISTWFVVALASCTLNPIGEDPGLSQDTNSNTTVGEGSPNDGVFPPGQGMSTPEGVDPTTGMPVSPNDQAPDPMVTDPIGEPSGVIEPDDDAPGDIISEPGAEPEEPILEPEPPSGAAMDGGVPFDDAGDAGDAADAADAAAPSNAR